MSDFVPRGARSPTLMVRPSRLLEAPGVAGGDYQADALKNLVLLWLQDIAALIAAPGDFELHAMMKEEESNDG